VRDEYTGSGCSERAVSAAWSSHTTNCTRQAEPLQFCMCFVAIPLSSWKMFSNQGQIMRELNLAAEAAGQ
jgi:hypothetical protein